jgi:N-acetylmuramoyl-L-alanine amidase
MSGLAIAPESTSKQAILRGVYESNNPDQPIGHRRGGALACPSPTPERRPPAKRTSPGRLVGGLLVLALATGAISLAPSERSRDVASNAPRIPVASLVDDTALLAHLVRQLVRIPLAQAVQRATTPLVGALSSPGPGQRWPAEPGPPSDFAPAALAPVAANPPPAPANAAPRHTAGPLIARLDGPTVEPGDFTKLVWDRDLDLSELFGLAVRRIVIDPGHGGRDSGTIGANGLTEKSVTLDIAHRLRARLERLPVFDVLLTRESDEHISLRDRVAFANDRQADLFISIHVNYLTSGPHTVIETYYFGPHEDAEALKLAQLENQGSEFTLGSFSEIIGKLKYRLKHEESRALAGSIQHNLYRHLKLTNRSLQDVGIKTAPFVVLLGADMPSVLAEVTCLNNRREAKRLATAKYRGEIASYLEKGILQYIRQRGRKPETDYTNTGAQSHAAREDTG